MTRTPDDAHPLFPPRSDDDEALDIGWIQVTRREPTGQQVWCPRKFAASELTDEAQLNELFGGGTYELIGRDAKGQRIIARRGLVLPGPSKPLFEAPPPSAEAHNPAPAAGPYSSHVPAQAQGPSWLPIVATIMPLILQWLTGQQQMNQQARQDSQAMLLAMMNQAQSSNAQIVTLLSNINRPADGGTKEGFREGMNFMQELLAGQLEQAQAAKAEHGEDESIMKTIEQITQAMGLVKDLTDMTNPNGAAKAAETVSTS